MVDACETATILLDDRCEPRGTLGWGVNDVKALFRNIKQGFEISKERLMFIKSERSSKLRASMQLVVATRLQE
jgi:hypothetical protein